MQKEFDRKSKLSEVMKNPFGRDVIETAAGGLGLDPEKLSSPLAGAISLGGLVKLSKGALDEGFIDVLCAKLNQYAKLPPIKHPEKITEKWWKSAVFYQIYPSSFMDTDSDGIGDLRGIISKLDYIKELGANALWLNPCYASPWQDNGYDISDYRNIRKEFGTLEDFDELLRGAHERGIRIIMDLVVNHSSDEHEWFKQAVKSKNNPYRDYYIWSDKPNNWQSIFSGSAWKYSDKTDSYYLHTFADKQVDLNWKNEKVRKEVADIVNFWYDRGVDGFRLDVINMIDKPDGFPDGSEAVGKIMDTLGVEYYFYGIRAHDYLRDMNAATTTGRDVATVGETPGVGMQLARYFTSEDRHELDMIFSFEHLYASANSRFTEKKFDLNHLKSNLTKWQLEYGNACWNSLFLDNHDNPRMLSRADARPEYRERLAKMLGTVQLTLKGTPFIYQGQELGMTNAVFEGLSDMRDVEVFNYFEQHKAELGEEKVLEILKYATRDHARTPMQWTSGKHGGFTDGTPWIAVNANCAQINAEAELADNNSVFAHYRELIALRKNTPALVYGEFVPESAKKKDLFCYTRKLEGKEYYVEANLSDGELARPKAVRGMKLLISNYGEPADKLRAYEANVYAVK